MDQLRQLEPKHRYDFATGTDARLGVGQVDRLAWH